eukprot:TRINITY_DN6616_c0_g1_i1.p1 TRINITY_DN6616_c0_g1~~TRINITY_DN6616_c0_g1_i1.p1  ORF type:complete len:122 (+),score=40.94 TRINITY_DN6616_c0_g1_i1:132-497(+)
MSLKLDAKAEEVLAEATSYVGMSVCQDRAVPYLQCMDAANGNPRSCAVHTRELQACIANQQDNIYQILGQLGAQRDASAGHKLQECIMSGEADCSGEALAAVMAGANCVVQEAHNAMKQLQ